MRNLRIFVFALGTLFISGCDDLLVQEPPDSLLPGDAIQSKEDLQEVLISAYDVLANTYNGNAQNLANLLSDNVARPNADARYESIWRRTSTIFNDFSNPVFFNWYIANLRANTVLDNIDQVDGLTDADRNKIIAEASFIRAICHFDVVRIYAQPYGFSSDNSHPGIAIRQSSDVANSVTPRASVGEVYDFILQNIEVAKIGLEDNQDKFARRGAVIALEAAVRFQMQNYQAAYDLSNEVIESGVYPFAPNDVSRYTFPEVSSEAIYYIFSADVNGVIDARNGGFRGQWNSEGNNPNLRVTEEYYNAITQYGGPRADLYNEVFQDGTAYYVTSIFNSANFHIPVLSTTQMMLIRAESAAELGISAEQSIEDINAIRERAYGFNGLNLVTGASFTEIRDAARTEMRFELPFEGQRTHDLKRRGAQGEPIVIRDAPWDCPGNVIQFPATERTDQFPLNPSGGC